MSLTHEEAQRRLEEAANGRLLSVGEERILEAHLSNCVACRQYAQDLADLDAHLSATLKARWPRSPRQNLAPVMQKIEKIERRQLIMKGASNSLKILALLTLILLLWFWRTEIQVIFVNNSDPALSAPERESESSLPTVVPTATPIQGEGPGIVPTAFPPTAVPLPLTPTTPPVTSSGAAPTATPIQVAVPTVTPPALPETFDSPTDVKIGDYAQVTGTVGVGVLLRLGPGPEYEAIAAVAENTLLLVIGGTVTGEDQLWWQVRLMDETEGWLAGEYLIPAANPDS